MCFFFGADSFCSIPHDHFDEKKFNFFLYVEGRLGAHETNYSKTFLKHNIKGLILQLKPQEITWEDTMLSPLTHSLGNVSMNFFKYLVLKQFCFYD
jgi:hypothetical protein